MNLLVRERADLLDDKAAYDAATMEADGWLQKYLGDQEDQSGSRCQECFLGHSAGRSEVSFLKSYQWPLLTSVGGGFFVFVHSFYADL